MRCLEWRMCEVLWPLVLQAARFAVPATCAQAVLGVSHYHVVFCVHFGTIDPYRDYMTGFFTQIEDTEDVRQGDIIRKLNPKTGETDKLGIVITADCDIAQRKAGERYTWLEIVPMTAYIEGPWAQEQLRKLSEKRSKATCEYLNGQIRKLRPGLAALTHESLVQWLRSKTAEEILASATGQAPAAGGKPLSDLQGFALTVTTDETQSAFSRLKAAWTLFGHEENKQQESVRSAFKDGGGFQDYFVLTELPRHTDFGLNRQFGRVFCAQRGWSRFLRLGSNRN